MSEAIPLPPRPNLEQYRKLARDFQRAGNSSEPGAVRSCATRMLETLARLRKLKIERREIDAEAKRIEARWNKLKPDGSLARAQLLIAREHGFASWPKFAKHIESLSRAGTPASDFEAAVDAIVAGNAATLKKLLRRNSGLVRARSEREHRSTLLHYVSANGVEDFRQKTPKNIVEIARILLDGGAEVDAESDAYGGGCTTLGLVATSVHPEKAGVQIALLKLLLDYGASLDHPSAGGNKSSVVRACLANGQPEAAEFLAELGAPVNLEAAAGLGRLALVKTFFDEPGVTRKEMEAAFESACWYGRTDVVEFLLERGIDPGLRNEAGQTGLHCAAYGGNVELVRLLLERGAPVDAKENSFDATALDVALWAWNNSQDATFRDGCYQVIALLARAGARLDREHWRDPESGEWGMLGEIDSDARMQAALRGRKES